MFTGGIVNTASRRGRDQPCVNPKLSSADFSMGLLSMTEDTSRLISNA